MKQWIEGWKRDIAGVRVKGSFARNAMYTFSDAAVNILSQIILTPIVASLYGPVAYGVYGLFSTISSNLSTIAGAGYPGAFVLPKEEPKFHALARLSVVLLAVIVLLSLPFFLFPSVLYRWFPSWSVMGPWCMAIPWMVLVLGATQIFLNWTTRAKEFALYAKIGPATNLSMRLLNLGFGILRKGTSFGLIVSELIVRSLACIWFVLGLRKHHLGQLSHGYHRAEMRAVATEYRDYPLYIFPGRWLNMFSTQLPILGLVALGDPAAVGRFSFASGLLLMPMRLFGYSLSAVFLRKATETGNDDPQALGELTRRLYMRLLALGLVPFVALTFFGDVVFHLVLGDAWRLAGTYCGLMGLFYFFRLLSEPLISIYNAQRTEKRLFYFYSTLFALNGAAVWLGTYFFRDPMVIVLLFADRKSVV